MKMNNLILKAQQGIVAKPNRQFKLFSNNSNDANDLSGLQSRMAEQSDVKSFSQEYNNNGTNYTRNSNLITTPQGDSIWNHSINVNGRERNLDAIYNADTKKYSYFTSGHEGNKEVYDVNELPSRIRTILNNAVKFNKGGLFLKSSFNIPKAQKGRQLIPSRNWDNTLTGQLINYSENPDSIGWDAKNRRWYAPPANKGYDVNQFGMGVDRNQTPGFSDRVKVDERGREYLTAEDERYLRFLAIDRANRSANERYEYAQRATGINGSVSPKNDAITVSAIYNLGPGRVARTIFEDKNAMQALFNRNSPVYQQAVHEQYREKNRNERINRELQFFRNRNK